MVPTSTPPLPITISKKELRNALNVGSKTNFRLKYMPDEVILSVVGVSVAEYSRLRVFDSAQTRRIIEYFRLEPKDFVI